MDAADGAPGPARVGLLAARASVALDLGSCAAPSLATTVAAERALVVLVCPCLDLRDRLRLVAKIPDFRLCVFDLSRVQVAEGIQKTAKVSV